MMPEKICFPFCFLQILTIRHNTQSILLLKLLIVEGKGLVFFAYYSLYYLIQIALWILIMDSEDILLEPPSKIWIQMEEWLSIF